jgi:hypothetical protein
MAPAARRPHPHSGGKPTPHPGDRPRVPRDHQGGRWGASFPGLVSPNSLPRLLRGRDRQERLALPRLHGARHACAPHRGTSRSDAEQRLSAPPQHLRAVVQPQACSHRRALAGAVLRRNGRERLPVPRDTAIRRPQRGARRTRRTSGRLAVLPLRRRRRRVRAGSAGGRGRNPAPFQPQPPAGSSPLPGVRRGARHEASASDVPQRSLRPLSDAGGAR